MSYAKTKLKRSTLEKIFIAFYLPAILFGYSLYKCGDLILSHQNYLKLYIFGKHPSFWYATFYTMIVCYISGKIIFSNKSPYKRGKNKVLSSYQRKKFTSIFFVQLVIVYLIPFIIIPLFKSKGINFFGDSVKPTGLDAYVYVSRAFKSWGGMTYTFILIPLSVWFFGKKYCSFFCACGNLAETIGITKWGAAWVKHKTPSGKLVKKMESLQTVLLIIGLIYGAFLFLDFLKLFTATTILQGFKAYQNIALDFIFGALIGVGAYPFFGTRMWCRFGCPLAKMMELQGRYFGSKFKVAANDKCKGLDLCSQVCPMGIDVASYAHKDKTPILGSFGLQTTPCIGCGGCVDVCPVDALKFV